MTRTTIPLLLTALLAGLTIAACGDGGDGAGDPAGAADDRKTVSGSFELLSGAPQGVDDVSGRAELIRSDAGTDATIELQGLEPSTKYAAHLHAGACDEADPGGPHFRFDDDGAEVPPNEIHLPFTTDADGAGTGVAHNDAVVPEGKARSIVVHTVADERTASDDGHAGHDDAAAKGKGESVKLACASLE